VGAETLSLKRCFPTRQIRSNAEKWSLVVEVAFSTGGDMKYRVILVAAVITLAGAASAHLLTPSSQSAAPQFSTRGNDAPTRVLLVDPPTNPRIQNSATVQRQASVDVRHAPVPLQVRPRTPVALPTIDTSETYAKGEADVTSTKGDKSNITREKSSENAARAAIEADGYKGVAMLRKGDNGVWHAKAFRGKTEVLLTVDSRGTVTLAN
jgi:hypothetical protein